eukprot:5900809-Prymnesium_polylepis.1
MAGGGLGRLDGHHGDARARQGATARGGHRPYHSPDITLLISPSYKFTLLIWQVDISEFFSESVARVEIVNANGELERIFFRFPTFCRMLSEEAKQKLLWGVDRDTPGAQLY